MLASIAQKPRTNFDDRELYPDMFIKAAVIYEAIVNYRVFVDGNKRTGFAAMARFLDINSYVLKVSDKEIENYTVSIATNNPHLEDVAAWIKKHSKKV
jgi:death-on-curing protein